MRIRSVTCFLRVNGTAANAQRIAAAGQFAKRSAAALESAGFAVQTIRLATQPLLTSRTDALASAGRLWQLCAEAGFDFLSFGPVPVNDDEASLAAIDRIPELIRRTENVFVGVLVRSLEHATAFRCVRRTARAV